jgi:hypothetical protein
VSSLIDELAIETAAEARTCKICRWEKTYFVDHGRRGDEEKINRAAEQDAYKAYNGEIMKLYRACNRLSPPLNCAYSTFVRHLRECR